MCDVPYCRNKPRPGRRKCDTCQSREKRKNNPLRYAYDALRANCKRRKGLGFFELTFEEFSRFAIETNYIAGKGRTKLSYTIDRIDNTMGYFIGNIQILTHSENSRKRNKILDYDWISGQARVIDNRPQSGENLPF